MRRILFPASNHKTVREATARWAYLPGWCCQAAGGDGCWADDVAVAWFLFFHAAQLMDKVEDRDELPLWLGENSVGIALNIASGLYFSACLALNNLYQSEHTRRMAGEIVDDFYKSLLRMCLGQQRELSARTPSLEQCWRSAEDKSGVFFALACRTGARLATDERVRLDQFCLFGHHLGLLIQILDDLEDLKNLSEAGTEQQISWSIPLAYAMQVLPPDEGERLRQCWQIAGQNPHAAHALFSMLEQCGSALYLRVEMKRHRRAACAALTTATQPSASQANLIHLLDRLVS